MKKRILLLLTALTLALGLVVPTAIPSLAHSGTSGNGITPTVYLGPPPNPPVPAGLTELKITPSVNGSPFNGVYTDGTLTVTISNSTANSFDWSSNIGVDVVYVKDGVDGANVYTYDPPAESTGDTGLTTPEDTTPPISVPHHKNISHAAFWYDGGGGATASSTISTEVHTADHTVISTSNPALAGMTVHDKVTLTFTPTSGTTLPTGSSITVNFYTNNTATGPNADNVTIDVSGQSSPVVLEPELTKGPLSTGNYSYRAIFTSGNTGIVPNAIGDAEPFDVAGLKVSKTAVPTFTRTYLWSITKSVDKTLVEQSSLTPPATFNYTVTVAQTGFTDSNWQVTGTITVSNPTAFAATGVDVTDSVNNGGTAVVTGGTGVTVPANGSVALGYTVTYASAPTSSSGINTATESLSGNSGTAAFAFTTPTTTVNKTVTVTDTFNSVTTTLGTVTATDSTPFATATYTYSHTVPIPNFGSVSYTNTAVIVQTGQSASQTVTVRRIPLATGALTMGYWQNKNGQGIITGANQANLKAFLTGYAPFQDIGSTAINVYVTNVIKAASGSTMNAMLKAQMLATALDVYFSDPALGGNKIGAPAPIGGVTIDLQFINKPIGSGTYENVSAAFGGAPSLTVSQMLAYAASQSNVGGSTWYGNVKATQELAKDAFDAINNQVAFTP